MSEAPPDGKVACALRDLCAKLEPEMAELLEDQWVAVQERGQPDVKAPTDELEMWPPERYVAMLLQAFVVEKSLDEQSRRLDQLLALAWSRRDR